SPLTWWQIDLPVTYAGMRGTAERTHIIARTGTDPQRIAILGNTSTDVLDAPLAPLAADRPGVLALSPDAEPQLARVIAIVRDAGLHNVIVAPHPRSDRRMLRRLMPAEWNLYT
ncbi:hypothetical protein, partial [Pseudomonas sp. PS02285]|uniref:hypothetical protein n=1 Tax=Pseudomonas sp. PS02285 TaxID=2991441 RepID=UPI00249BE972